MSRYEFVRPYGQLSARIHGAYQLLNERAAGASSAALELSDQDGYLAASMRGKAAGYREAAEVIKALEKGWKFPRRFKFLRRRTSA